MNMDDALDAIERITAAQQRLNEHHARYLAHAAYYGVPESTRKQRARWRLARSVRSWRERIARCIAPWLEED